LRESISTFLDLFTRPEFQMGLVFGIVGFVVLAAQSQRRAVRGWGLIFAVLIVVGMQIEEGSAPALTVAAVLMGIGGALRAAGKSASDSRKVLVPLGWLLILVGAVFSTSLAFEYSNSFFVPATLIVAIGTGWALSTWEEGPHRSSLGPLFAISAFGIWTTVPDTDLARILVGIAIPMAFATLPPIGARISGAGGFALAAALAWLPLWGGDQRTGSVIGAWACIGMIALLPAAMRLMPGLRIATWQLFAMHIGIVLVSARVIGLWDRATVALLGAALLAAAMLGLVMLIHRGHPRVEQPDPIAPR
jgi:hypothetical protein